MQNNPLSDQDIPQLDAMRMGVDYRMQLKSRDFTLMVRPLALSEMLKVYATVQDKLKTLPDTYKNQLTEHTVLAQETLKIASTSRVNGTDYVISDMMMQAMTPDELHFLYKQYVAACDRVNPSLDLLKEEEILALVDELKKNLTPDLELRLTELSFFQHMSLVRYFLTKVD